VANKRTLHSTPLPHFSSLTLECGIDEAGRGCLAGPVVAAAVILPKDFSHPLIYDSKALTLSQREEAESIIKDAATAYAIAEVSAQIIDEINILQASFTAMHGAIDKLTLKPELLVIDGNRFRPYPFIEHQCVIKGDSKVIAMAAASILAKTHRDRLMKTLAEQYPQYGWHTNVGYPSIKHRKALQEHGHTPHHRLTFNGVLPS